MGALLHCAERGLTSTGSLWLKARMTENKSERPNSENMETEQSDG